MLIAIASALAFAASCEPRADREAASAPARAGEPSFVPASDARVAVMGRVDRSGHDHLRIGYPGVTMRVRFEGASLGMRVASSTGKSYVDVIVDGGAPTTIHIAQGESDVVLARGLSGGVHSVDVVHRTETWQGTIDARGFLLAPGGRLLQPSAWPERRMLFIGDSVTCGEAIDRASSTKDCKKDSSWWDPRASYGMVLARALDAQSNLVCYGGRGLVRDWRGRTDVVHAPGYFDLAVPDDASPAPWDHASYVPDAVVVSLGTNDFNLAIGALPDRDVYVGAYVRFVRAILARYPRTHVFLTEGAIVNDEADPKRPQKTVLRAYLAETARLVGDARVHLVEATHYPGDACDFHPTREQHAAMARDLEPVIRRVLGW